MITLNKNYNIKTDATHGFILQYESDEYEKEVVIKKKKVTKMITNKEAYYFPKLSMCLDKFFKLNLTNTKSVDLFASLENIETIIEKFEKTFAKNGNVINL